ncbi:MAG: dethiobiotin synthetase [Candidatus Midichloriaceae bacterium]|jgi:dethiobiotin synthetase
MQIFITGTDTNIGKTIVSSWICLHTKYEYFKPIQTGNIEETDTEIVQKLSGVKVHKESYTYKAPLSPHIASNLEKEEIDIEKIKLPTSKNLIIEGAGGVFVPINKNQMMIDLISHFNIPAIIVSSSKLGTINHTLLTLSALRNKNIKMLGVILNGPQNKENENAITNFGKIDIIASLPPLNKINTNFLQNIHLPHKLNEILTINN